MGAGNTNVTLATRSMVHKTSKSNLCLLFFIHFHKRDCIFAYIGIIRKIRPSGLGHRAANVRERQSALQRLRLVDWGGLTPKPLASSVPGPGTRKDHTRYKGVGRKSMP